MIRAGRVLGSAYGPQTLVFNTTLFIVGNSVIIKDKHMKWNVVSFVTVVKAFVTVDKALVANEYCTEVLVYLRATD